MLYWTAIKRAYSQQWNEFSHTGYMNLTANSFILKYARCNLWKFYLRMIHHPKPGFSMRPAMSSLAAPWAVLLASLFRCSIMFQTKLFEIPLVNLCCIYKYLILYIYYVLHILIDSLIYYFSMSILALVQWFYVCFIEFNYVHAFSVASTNFKWELLLVFLNCPTLNNFFLLLLFLFPYSYQISLIAK